MSKLKAYRFFPEAIPSLAAVFYNKVPAGTFKNFYREVAREVVTGRQRGKILDIGTGPGYLPIEVAKLNSNLDIVGIDLNPKMVEIAKKNAKKEGIKNVTFQLADANELPYEDESFDFVVSTAALHHWHDRESVFKSINRVLKKGATCWVYDLRRDATKDEIRNTLKKPDSRIWYMRWAIRFHGLTTDEYCVEIKSLLENMKLKNFDIEKIDAFMRISWKKPQESS